MDKDSENDIGFNEMDDTKKVPLAERQSCKSGKETNIIDRIRTDQVFRHKFAVSLSLFWLSICLGWNVSQLGPALQDLMIITTTKLNEASYFLTTDSLGFLLGASVAGWIFKKINSMLVMSVLNTVLAIVTISIPWCQYYGMMIVLFLLRGTSRGIVDAGCNILIIETWGVENGPYMQTLHFVFAIGGIVSPLATAPFLSASEYNMMITEGNSTEYILYLKNESNRNLNLSTSSFVKLNHTFNMEYQTSRIHGAFVISGVLILSAAASFAYFVFIMSKRNNIEDVKAPRLKRNSARLIKIISISILCCTFLSYLVVEKAMVFFLSTFTVEHLKWTTKRGSYVTTIYWTAFAIGRFIGIGITKRFPTKRILMLYISMLMLSSIGLMLTNIFRFDVGIWIFVPLSGFSQSILFPLLLSWIEEDFFKVSGKMISLLLFVGSIGTMITPIMLGYLMDLYSPMWFPYSQVIASVFLLSFFVVLLILSGKFQNNVNEIEQFVESSMEAFANKGIK